MARALSGGAGSGQAAKAVDDWLAGTWAPRRILRTDSGTSALRLAIEAAIAVTGEPRVAAPAYVCYDVATALDGARATPILYDLDPLTLGPDPESLRRAFDRGARSVIVAHLYGVPLDMESIGRLARDHGALIIEDAAQAIGAVCSGRPAGALGDLGVLSFGRGKGVTGGGGGALLVFEKRVDAAVPATLPASASTVRNRLALLAQGVLARPGLYWIPASLPGTGLGETVYHAPWAATRQSDFSTGVLAVTMALAETEARIRAAHAETFQGWLAGHPRIAAITPPGNGLASWLRFPVLAEGVGDSPYSAGAGKLGVMPGYPLSLADLPGFRERVENAADRFPGARRLAARLGTLPSHGLLAHSDLAALKRWLEGLR